MLHDFVNCTLPGVSSLQLQTMATAAAAAEDSHYSYASANSAAACPLPSSQAVGSSMSTAVLTSCWQQHVHCRPYKLLAAPGAAALPRGNKGVGVQLAHLAQLEHWYCYSTSHD
jgi:hypothetical protein